MTNSGKPPLVACTRAASSPDSGVPVTAEDSVAVSSRSRGVRATWSTRTAAPARPGQPTARRVRRRLVLPQRDHHHQRPVAAEPEQERQPRQRLLVAPLHVVEHQQQRRRTARNARASPSKKRCRCHASTLARSPVAGTGHRTRTVEDVGREPSHLVAPDGVERPGRRPQVGGPQPLRDRGQHQPAGRVEALGVGHHAPARADAGRRARRPAGSCPRRPGRGPPRPGPAARGPSPPTAPPAGAADLPVPPAGPGRVRSDGRWPAGPRRVHGAGRSGASTARRVSAAGATPSSRSSTAAQWW